jgi:hypothetical protein
MKDNLLEKYTARGTALEDADLVSDAEDLGAFGFLRGMQARSVMVELRKRSGETLAVGYGYIDRILLDPSEGITLCCGTRNIAIKGRNLNKEIRPQVTLFQGLTRNRVPWLAEANQATMLQAQKNAVIIESIRWE